MRTHETTFVRRKDVAIHFYSLFYPGRGKYGVYPKNTGSETGIHS